MKEDKNSRIETELEVKSYIQDLKYALDHGAKISFQVKRMVDQERDIRYTNYGCGTTFVMSFHFAEKAFEPEMFPYKKC